MDIFFIVFSSFTSFSLDHSSKGRWVDWKPIDHSSKGRWVDWKPIDHSSKGRWVDWKTIDHSSKGQWKPINHSSNGWWVEWKSIDRFTDSLSDDDNVEHCVEYDGYPNRKFMPKGCEDWFSDFFMFWISSILLCIYKVYI